MLSWAQNQEQLTYSQLLVFDLPMTYLKGACYALPEATHVRVQIFDINGRQVKRLVDQMCNAGVHSVVWDGTDEAQQKVASGIYICRFSAGEVVLNRKLILTK